MPMKDFLQRLQPIQVYIVLGLSICYFIVQFYVSQTSQSITLLVQTYHMLCNVLALSGCIICIKNDNTTKRSSESSNESIDQTGKDQTQKEIVAKQTKDKKKRQQQHERTLKNTFGWARVDVLTMVIVCTFMTSLCFSIVIESIQTLFHVGHHDHLQHKGEYHTYPYEICIILGALGLVLNGISYLLIGGYTFHQGSFLHLTADGNVYILDRNEGDIDKQASNDVKSKRKSQLLHELSRDACSSVMVIICSTIVVVCKSEHSLELRAVDPIFAILSIIILLTLSFPYMKEAGMILLQTIPDTIDIEDFQKQILNKFPQIQSIHDLHIWQLNQHKFVSTAHLIFQDPNVFANSINDIIDFFHEQGINIITIQPEFKTLDCVGSDATCSSEIALVNDSNQDLCLVACRQVTCEEKLCCQRKTSEHSLDSLNNKSKIDSQVLEQVISVRNVSAEELDSVDKEFISIKSLNGISEDSISTNDTNSGESQNKRLHSSLYIPSRYKKLHKTASVSDRQHEAMPTSSSQSDDIHLVSFKRVVSESAIKSDEHDMGRQASDIFVENKLLKQTNTTDNNETEDIYTKTENCDS